MAPWDEIRNLDALILAVSHDYFMKMPRGELFSRMRSPGVFMDVKSCIDPCSLPAGIEYWSL